jgi:D-3-phosphoglycerate dehydrogenase
VSSETKYLVNKKLLKHSKQDQIIINTSRGEIVNEKDIISSLNKREIAGYGADVIENEFDDINKSIIIKNIDKLNIIVTPHIGGMTLEGQLRAWQYAVNKFERIK